MLFEKSVISDNVQRRRGGLDAMEAKVKQLGGRRHCGARKQDRRGGWGTGSGGSVITMMRAIRSL